MLPYQEIDTELSEVFVSKAERDAKAKEIEKQEAENLQERAHKAEKKHHGGDGDAQPAPTARFSKISLLRSLEATPQTAISINTDDD